MKIERTNLKKAILKLTALEHPLRFSICQHLADQEGQGFIEIGVTDLFIKFRCEQCVMSKHLGILRKAGFINSRRDGKEVFYSLSNEIDYIAPLITKFLKNEYKYANSSLPVHTNIG
jgi:DNA-binding transcriptional ArsR family regulator